MSIAETNKAIEKYQDVTNIQAIAYFGDEIINEETVKKFAFLPLVIQNIGSFD